MAYQPFGEPEPYEPSIASNGTVLAVRDILFVLGHPATKDWCLAVDGHHAVTEAEVKRLTAELARVEKDLQNLTELAVSQEPHVTDAFCLAKELGQSEFDSMPPVVFIRGKVADLKTYCVNRSGSL
jgi:predicted trehalose synthase